MKRSNAQTELTWPRVSTQLQHRVPPSTQLINSRLQTTAVGLPAPYEPHGNRAHRRTRLLSGVLSGHFSRSRIPPAENGCFRLDFFSTGFFWSFFLSSVELLLLAFELFLEAVGVREYRAVQQAKSVGSSVLRAVSASNGSTNLRPSELVALGSAESRQSYVRGVALSREPPKLQQTQPLLAAWDRDRALLCRRVIHAAGARN